MAPGGPPYRLATFVPEKKGAPATVRLWQYPDFGEGRFLATKTFYKASEVQLMWAPNGTALLIHTHTEVDKTGKSYYGETGLFHMNVAGQARRRHSSPSHARATHAASAARVPRLSLAHDSPKRPERFFGCHERAAGADYARGRGEE